MCVAVELAEPPIGGVLNHTIDVEPEAQEVPSELGGLAGLCDEAADFDLNAVRSFGDESAPQLRDHRQASRIFPRDRSVLRGKQRCGSRRQRPIIREPASIVGRNRAVGGAGTEDDHEHAISLRLPAGERLEAPAVHAPACWLHTRHRPLRAHTESPHSGHRIKVLVFQEVTTLPTRSGRHTVIGIPVAKAVSVSGDPSAGAAGRARHRWQ